MSPHEANQLLITPPDIGTRSQLNKVEWCMALQSKSIAG